MCNPAAELYVDFSLILPSNREIVLRRVARTPPLAGGGVRNHGGGILPERDDVTSVIIFTRNYRVAGEVVLAHQNRRLTDYMLEAKEFITS